ncbi:MAG: CRTAC1 family protein, partial [Caldilineaceae bacterium]
DALPVEEAGISRPASHQSTAGTPPPPYNPAGISGDIRFRDVAAEVGLDFSHAAFRWSVSPDPVAAMGGGLCWLDYDNDGWTDLYLVNSYAVDEKARWQTEGGLPTNALYHNQSGRFVDVSDQSGSALSLAGNGCLAADLNNDGWTDLYITTAGANALLWNNGDGTFSEGGAAAGLAAPEWNSAAVAGDLNGDGLLDLFVAAYIDLKHKIPKPAGAFPQDYYGLPDRLYLNEGIGPDGRATFRDVTAQAGLHRAERGLGALLSDLDQDGDLDLYIANDGHPNRLYANESAPDDPMGLGFRLVDATETAQVGDSGSGMGVAGGDYDGDGWGDLLITNWERELNALYRNESGDGEPLVFQYSTFRIGVAGLGSGLTGWGVHLADFDQDTDTDILIVNGRVPVSNLSTDPETPRYYRNRSVNLDGATSQSASFFDWTGGVGLKGQEFLGRGSALADFDNDGDLDIAIAQIAGPVVLLRNDGEPGHWLQVVPHPPSPGTVATVELPDGRVLRRELYAGSSYLATEDSRLHFGLGGYTAVPRLTIRWPDGTERTFSHVAADQQFAAAR